MPRSTRPSLPFMAAATPLLAAVALAALLQAAPARADGARGDDDCRGHPILRAQAVAIALMAGVVRVTEVDCDDDEWEVEGWTAAGRKIEVEIDARTGRIKEIEYDG